MTWISNTIYRGQSCSMIWKWEVIVCFVDIGGIVDHHCLRFLFIVILDSVRGYFIAKKWKKGLTYTFNWITPHNYIRSFPLIWYYSIVLILVRRYICNYWSLWKLNGSFKLYIYVIDTLKLYRYTFSTKIYNLRHRIQ
jgi:hypothetical protein